MGANWEEEMDNIDSVYENIVIPRGPGGGVQRSGCEVNAKVKDQLTGRSWRCEMIWQQQRG